MDAWVRRPYSPSPSSCLWRRLRRVPGGCEGFSTGRRNGPGVRSRTVGGSRSGLMRQTWETDFMAVEMLVMLTAGVFVVALLYSSVGHAGASGYIAVMTLLSLAPAEIKPIALALNILVASIGSWQFWRAGHFSWSLFWPFALLSVPFAFVGGYLDLPTQVFKVIVGIVLLVSAAQFLVRPPAEGESHAPARPLAMGVGAGLGLLSGMTGTGGGIFLTPLLIFLDRKSVV